MFGLPMAIVGPVLGIGSIVMIVAGAQVMVRFFNAKIAQSESKSRAVDPTERDRLLDDLQARLGELEERVDFTERLLARQHEEKRLDPPPG